MLSLTFSSLSRPSNAFSVLPQFKKLNLTKSFMTSGIMAKIPKVLVTRGDIPEVALNFMKEKCEVDVWPEGKPIERKELLQRIEGKDALFCLLTEKIDKEVLDHAGPSLKVIATMSVGYDHLDLNEIKKRRITVGYTPNVLTSATAELTVALALATSRRLFEAHEEVVNGGWGNCAWSPLWMCGSGLIGANVGIIGLGRIGLAVAKRLHVFEVSKIFYSGRNPREEASQVSAEFVSLDQLLRQSDIVIITCALSEETKNLIDASALSKMKSNAILINTSRGGIVDQEALIDALKTSKIAAAGLDVMTPEPLPVNHELTKLKNCVLLPHIGSATIQTRTGMAMMTAQNIINALEGTTMPAKLC